MSRGQEQSVINTASQTQAAQQAAANQTLQQNRGIEAPAVASLQGQIANPGYTAAQKSALTNNTMGATNAAYDSLASAAKQHVATTNNAAGYSSLLDQLARDRGHEQSGAANAITTEEANNAQQQAAAAQAGLGQLYGANNSLYGAQVGSAGQALNTQQEAAKMPGFWDTLTNSLVSGAAQVGAAAVKG